jgi:hypothetical protein
LEGAEICNLDDADDDAELGLENHNLLLLEKGLLLADLEGAGLDCRGISYNLCCGHAGCTEGNQC